jgi:hypothetical protein
MKLSSWCKLVISFGSVVSAFKNKTEFYHASQEIIMYPLKMLVDIVFMFIVALAPEHNGIVDVHAIILNQGRGQLP